MIREATKDEYESFATLFGERGVDTLVSDRDGRVDGYVSFFALRDAGHVKKLVVAPGAGNLGVAEDLMLAAAAVLRARGRSEWHSNVGRDNAAAIRLYQDKLGMTIEHATTVIRLPWTALSTLPGERATALPVAIDEEDDIERALGLLSGRIAMARKRADRMLLQLRDATCAPVGFAVFDPATGSAPFRVARPALAATLLAAIRPQSRGDEIQVVVEDDPDLTHALLAAGGVLEHEVLHYRGAL